MKYSRPGSMRGLRLNWRLPSSLTIGCPQYFVECGDMAMGPGESSTEIEWFSNPVEAEALFEQRVDDGLCAFLGEYGIGEFRNLKNPVADRWIYRWNCYFDLECQQERFFGFPASHPLRRYVYEPLNLEAINTFYFTSDDEAVSPSFESPTYDDDDLVRKANQPISEYVQPGPDDIEPAEEDTWAKISRS